MVPLAAAGLIPRTENPPERGIGFFSFPVSQSCKSLTCAAPPAPTYRVPLRPLQDPGCCFAAWAFCPIVSAMRDNHLTTQPSHMKRKCPGPSRLLLSCTIILAVLAASPLAVADGDIPPPEILKKYKIDLRHLDKQEYLSVMRIEHLIDRKVEASVNEKFSDNLLVQVEKEAKKLYPYYEVGDLVQITTRGRTIKGTIAHIGGRFIRVDSIKVHRDDFPFTAFKKDKAKKFQEKYVDRKFYGKRDEYRAYLAEKREKMIGKTLRNNGYVFFEGDWLTTKHVVELWQAGEFHEQAQQPIDDNGFDFDF